MANETETPGEVEKVNIEPAPEGSEIVEAPEGAEPEEGAEPVAPAHPEPKEALVRSQSPAPAAPAAEPAKPALAEVDGETPKERALRQRVADLETEAKDRRNAELGIGTPPPGAVSPNRQAILNKYKPAELQALQEAAEALGFVKGDTLQTQSYSEKAQSYLDAFLDQHKEYSPANDPKGDLWNAFRQEFGIYRQPSDPKDFPRIFNKVHAAVFGIQPSRADGKTAAATEKVKVASSGSAPAPSNTPARTRVNAPAGVRTDMLKGFTAEEMKEMGIE